ncbi:MAG: flippase [Solirubrobacterales bacterium]|nr:flippase [Solirubrobacterales bacterium]
MSQVLRRFAVLGASSMFTQLIAFVALAIVARRVGPSNLGSYTVALSIVAFLSLPISQGMTMVGVRDVARDRGRARAVTGEVLLLQLALGVPAYLVLVALSGVIAPNKTMESLIPVVGLFLFTATSFEWTLQGLGRMQEIAVARTVGQVGYGVAVPLLVGPGLAGIQTYAWLMVGGLALKHVLTVAFLVRDVGRPELRVSAGALRRRMRGSLAMGYASVMGQIYGTIDQIMLGYFSTAYDAGQYAAAYRIPNAVGTFSSSWLSALFPHNAELAEKNPARLRADAGRMLSVVALFAIPLMACTPFIAHELMVAAFGSEYGPAASAFALLIVGTALSIVDSTLMSMLMGLGRDRFYALVLTVTALFNGLANLAVIPVFGRNGAAIVTIVSELVAFTLVVHGAQRALGGLEPEWGRLGRIVLAAAGAVVVLVLMPATVSVWVLIAIGVAVYALAGLLLGTVSGAELRAIFSRPSPINEPAT